MSIWEQWTSAFIKYLKQSQFCFCIFTCMNINCWSLDQYSAECWNRDKPLSPNLESVHVAALPSGLYIICRLKQWLKWLDISPWHIWGSILKLQPFGWSCHCFSCHSSVTQQCHIGSTLWAIQSASGNLLPKESWNWVTVIICKIINTTHHQVSLILVWAMLVRQILPGRWTGNSSYMRAAALYLHCFIFTSIACYHNIGKWGCF